MKVILVFIDYSVLTLYVLLQFTFIFVFSNSWGETLKNQKSALRWDIKRAMKGLVCFLCFCVKALSVCPVPCPANDIKTTVGI